MKGLVNAVRGVDRTRVLGIDPSSNSIAFTLVEDGRPTKWGKMIFFRKSTMGAKMVMLSHLLDEIIKFTGEPTHVVIEEMIFVQNPQASRVLSYIAGAIQYDLVNRGIEVECVPPMVWKNWHGHTKVTKALIAANGWNKKQADHFRKSQIQDKIADEWDWFRYSDSDVADSCGIALWGAEVSLK